MESKKLNAITLPVKEYNSVNSLCVHLQQVLGGYQADYAVFQIMTGNDSKDNQSYPKYLNYITPVSEGSKVYRLRYQARTRNFFGKWYSDCRNTSGRLRRNGFFYMYGVCWNLFFPNLDIP